MRPSGERTDKRPLPPEQEERERETEIMARVATTGRCASGFRGAEDHHHASASGRTKPRHVRARAEAQPLATTTATTGPPSRLVGGLVPSLSVASGSGCLLQTICDLTGVDCHPHCAPFFASTALFLGFSALAKHELSRFAALRELESRRLNVVVTGGTRGIGRALAREFLRRGDRVVISSRDDQVVRQTCTDLAQQTQREPEACMGWACDVSDPKSVESLARRASVEMGSVDVWVNNAGCSGGFRPFLESDSGDLEEVVRTNLLGTLHGTKAALRLFGDQRGGGHVFNMDGAGYDGRATPNYACYGATKAAITQLNRTLHEEVRRLGGTSASGSPLGNVGVHTLSPGMVLTDLLLEGSTVENRKAFNILCEHPETVASNLVPRIRQVAVGNKSGRQVRYLTLRRALSFAAKWHERNGRFFDKTGNSRYVECEEERLGSAEGSAAAKEEENGGRRGGRERSMRQAADRLANLYFASFVGAYLVLAEIATAQSL